LKYRILHNTPLEFFNTSADLVGSITANGTNLKISSVSGVIELGNTATDIQVGTIGMAVNWSFMGGGTIGAAGGGTISLGQSGDTVNMNVAGVTYQYPASFLRYNQITGVNNKIDISTSVPGSVILTLPNRPVVGQLSLTDNIAANSNTTGTLQVAGGASVTGNLYAGNVVSLGTETATRFISTQATGTAPFGVTSTTVVTNLNADLLDGLDGTSYANSTFAQAGFNAANTAQTTATAGFTAANTAQTTATNALSNTAQVLTVNSATRIVVANTTASTSNTTGALIVTGGVGVSGNLFAGNVVSLGGITVEGSLDPGSGDYAGWRANGTNIILKGNDVGRSGIFFQSEKNGVNINHPTDFGYIQFHPMGIDGSTGESNKMVIGVANDADDFLVLQSPYKNGVKISFKDATSGTGGTEYTVWHAGNHGVGSGLDADLLDGLNSTSFANSVYDQAGFDKANTAQTTASAAFTVANNASTNAGTAGSAASTAQATATGAFNAANNAQSTASTAQTSASAAFTQANTAITSAQSGFNQANAAIASAQNAYNIANGSSQLAFSNVTVNGVLLDAPNKQSTLTLTSGNGVTLLANSTADSINVGLTSTGVNAGTYGSANSVPIITIDTQGRITFANAVSIGSSSGASSGYPRSSLTTVYGTLSSKDLRTGPDNVTAETPFDRAVDAFGVLITPVYDCMDPVGSYVTFDLNT